jgi:predicted adenylyl cyclase CyaB
MFIREIEAKILDIDRKDVEKKFEDFVARKTFDGEINALFFDFENGGFGNEKINLRLRKENERAVLTLKKFVEHDYAKMRDEIETEIGDFYEMKKILDGIGLVIVKKARKYRTEYEYKWTHFVLDKYLDEYDFIPEFLEIEGKNVEEVYRFAELLGYKKEDCKAWTLNDLIKHYS